MYRGLRFKLSFYRRDRERRMSALWRLTHPMPEGGCLCWLCHLPIDSNDLVNYLTLDHVLPQDLAIRYGLDASVLFDLRNIQPAHHLCNSHRGNSLPTYTQLESIPHISSWLLEQVQTVRRLQAQR